jgi:transcriptional regulator with XRE-family HTH domain
MRSKVWDDPVVQIGLEAIGDMIRRARVRRVLSQRHLGRLAGVHASTISRLENGTLHGCRLSTLARIIAALQGAVELPADVRPARRPLTPVPAPTGYTTSWNHAWLRTR